jgi:transposase, IS5 family
VLIQEAENQIITRYEVFDERPSDRDLLAPSVEAQQEMFGRVPRQVAADAGFYSQAQENAARQLSLKRIANPTATRKARSAKSRRRVAGSSAHKRGGPVVRAASV